MELKGKKLDRDKLIYLIVCALAVMTPLLAGVLFCLKDGKSIADIYIPLGGWSDEITYYKQVDALVNGGGIKGFFGFNQSQAPIGGFAYWGPLPIIPYVLWGLIFGWNYSAPIYANIFFVALGIAVVLLVTRPKLIHIVFFIIAMFSSPMVLRHMLSGVAEPMYFMLLMIAVACALDYFKEDKFKTASFVICLIAISLLTMMRGYYAVLYLIPFWKCVKKKKAIPWVIGSAIVAVIGFALIRKFFCASYYGGVIGTDIADSIKSFGTNIILMAKYVWYAIRYRDGMVPWCYVLWITSMLCMGVDFTVYYINNKKVKETVLQTLIMNTSVFVAIFVLYDVGVGGRHLLTMTVVNFVVMLVDMDYRYFISTIIVGVAAFFLMNQIERLPYVDEEYALWMAELEEDFRECIVLTDDLSADNCMAMPTSDDNECTYYGYMFAAPAGMGVSLDEREFYNDPSNLTADYIMVHPYGSARYILEDAGYECIYECDKLMLYHSCD